MNFESMYVRSSASLCFKSEDWEVLESPITKTLHYMELFLFICIQVSTRYSFLCPHSKKVGRIALLLSVAQSANSFLSFSRRGCKY